MKKVIRKYGASYVIILDNQDREIYDLAEGDIIDIKIKNVIKKGGIKDGQRNK